MERTYSRSFWVDFAFTPASVAEVEAGSRPTLTRVNEAEACPHQVLDKILLRRTKEGRSADILLPPKTIILRKDRLDKFEEDFYQVNIVKCLGLV